MGITEETTTEPGNSPPPADRALGSDPVSPVTVSQIVCKHGDFVWRTLRRLGVRDADVDDVCQEVFVIVIRKLDDFEPRASMKSWLYGICLRSAAAHRRKAHVRREIPTEALEQTSTERPPDASYEGREGLAMLDRALASLDDDKRETFVLFEVEQLPMTEVATIMACPLQTAYSRHRAAREQVVAFFKRAALLEGGGTSSKGGGE